IQPRDHPRNLHPDRRLAVMLLDGRLGRGAGLVQHRLARLVRQREGMRAQRRMWAVFLELVLIGMRMLELDAGLGIRKCRRQRGERRRGGSANVHEGLCTYTWFAFSSATHVATILFVVDLSARLMLSSA